MEHSSNPYRLALKEAMALAHEVKTHPQAKAQFAELYPQLEAENPQMAELVKQLWDEYITLQRSAAFWKGMSDAEKELSDKITEANIQLQHNYNRLIQEQ